MVGSATFTIATSRTTMNWAATRTASPNQRFRSAAAPSVLVTIMASLIQFPLKSFAGSTIHTTNDPALHLFRDEPRHVPELPPGRDARPSGGAPRAPRDGHEDGVDGALRGGRLQRLPLRRPRPPGRGRAPDPGHDRRRARRRPEHARGAPRPARGAGADRAAPRPERPPPPDGQARPRRPAPAGRVPEDRREDRGRLPRAARRGGARDAARPAPTGCGPSRHALRARADVRFVALGPPMSSGRLRRQ